VKYRGYSSNRILKRFLVFPIDLDLRRKNLDRGPADNQVVQFAGEFNAVNEMYLKYFKIFGIEKYVMRFSTSAPEGMGKKYVN
jgi:hypothetical protein